MVERTRRWAASRPRGAADCLPDFRAQLRDTRADEFAGGEDERSALLRETEHDSVALASAGAEAMRLETTLERADREVTGREADSLRSSSRRCAHS